MLKDTGQRYGLITRLLHGIMALLIVWQFMKFFDRIQDGEHWVGQNLASWHIAIGSVLLLLIVLRLVWAVSQRGHRPVAASQGALVKAGHGLLYLTMLLLPITGVLFMLGYGYGWEAFGLELVAGGGDDVAWMVTLGRAHSWLAWGLLVLVVGHITLALIHRLVKKDGVFERMF